MKTGISLMLGLLLAVVLVFAYWLQTPHGLGTQGKPLDRALKQVDGASNPAGR